MHAYKPGGYNSVSPYLVVDGASRTVDFLVRGFGAVELRRIPGAEGRIMHAEVRIDDTVVMVTDGATGFLPIPSHVHAMSPTSTLRTVAHWRRVRLRCRNP